MANYNFSTKILKTFQQDFKLLKLETKFYNYSMLDRFNKNKSPFGYPDIFLVLIHFLRRRMALPDDLCDYEADLGQAFGCILQLISWKIEAQGIV